MMTHTNCEGISGQIEKLKLKYLILSLQSISRDVADNLNHPRRLDPTVELITYSFVLYLQHGRHDVKYLALDLGIAHCPPY